MFIQERGVSKVIVCCRIQRYFDIYRFPTFDMSLSIWIGSALGFLWLLSRAQFRVIFVIKAPNVAVAP